MTVRLGLKFGCTVSEIYTPIEGAMDIIAEDIRPLARKSMILSVAKAVISQPMNTIGTANKIAFLLPNHPLKYPPNGAKIIPHIQNNAAYLGFMGKNSFNGHLGILNNNFRIIFSS